MRCTRPRTSPSPPPARAPARGTRPVISPQLDSPRPKKLRPGTDLEWRERLIRRLNLIKQLPCRRERRDLAAPNTVSTPLIPVRPPSPCRDVRVASKCSDESNEIARISMGVHSSLRSQQHSMPRKPDVLCNNAKRNKPGTRPGSNMNAFRKMLEELNAGAHKKIRSSETQQALTRSASPCTTSSCDRTVSDRRHGREYMVRHDNIPGSFAANACNHLQGDFRPLRRT